MKWNFQFTIFNFFTDKEVENVKRSMFLFISFKKLSDNEYQGSIEKELYEEDTVLFSMDSIYGKTENNEIHQKIEKDLPHPSSSDPSRQSSMPSQRWSKLTH